MAVSQKQIAEELGVSITLVSRVLSGKAAEIGISAETIERVIKTAEAMGYVPSAAALTLKGKSTRTIGVVVYDFNDPFLGALIKQIQIQAHEHNYSLVLAGFLSRIPDEQDLQSLHKHAIDGVIVLGSDDTEAPWLKSFNHLPVARIGHGVPSEDSFRITVDDVDAASQLIRHLIDRDRIRPVFIGAPLPAHRLRKTAFEQAAQTLGIEIHSVMSSDRDAVGAGRDSARQVLATLPQTNALLCSNDRVAIGALQTLHEADCEVPRQIAVTGFDGISAAEQFIPSITTIEQPLQEIVHRAFKAIFEPSQNTETLLPGRLIARQTT